MTKKEEEKREEKEAIIKKKKVSSECVLCPIFGLDCEGALICPKIESCSQR